MSDINDGQIASLDADFSKASNGCFSSKQIRSLIDTLFVKFSLKNFNSFVTIAVGSLSGCSRVAGLLRQDGSWGGWWNKAGNQEHELPPSTDPEFVFLRKGPPVDGINPPPGYEIAFDCPELFQGPDGQWTLFPVQYVGISPNKLTFPESEEG